MFKKFTLEESVASQTQVKSSVARGLKKRIIEQYPMVEATLEEMMPKKAPVVLIQCRDEQKTQIVVVSEQPIFFCVRDGPMMPTLRLLHTYPCLLDGVRVDKGAIPYVMGGANVAAAWDNEGGPCDVSDESLPLVLVASSSSAACEAASGDNIDAIPVAPDGWGEA